jgi:hypothetical protein
VNKVNIIFKIHLLHFNTVLPGFEEKITKKMLLMQLEEFVILVLYKACPSESGTEVGAPLFPAIEICDFSGRWTCMSGGIWYTLDSGSVLLTEAEAR